MLQDLPGLDLLHAALLRQGLVEVETVEEQVRLVAHALLEALALGLLVVGGEDGLVDGVGALVDDDAGALARAEAADIGETLLGDDDVEVVLGLVDVGAHGDDARHAVGVGLGGAGGGSVHDGVLGVAEEVGRAAQAVEHAGAVDAGGVGVGVDVDLDGGVHADDAEAADDLGGVGHGLASEQRLGRVQVPVLVEAAEALGGEAHRRGRGVVELARVEEVEEGVLDDLGPDVEVLELGLVEAADDGVGDVADAGLQGQQVLGEAALGDLVLEELNQVVSDAERVLVGGGVVGGGVLVVGLDDGDDLGGVNGHGLGSDAVSDAGDLVGLAVGREISEGDVVKALEGGNGGVDLDDDLGITLLAV